MQIISNDHFAQDKVESQKKPIQRPRMEVCSLIIALYWE